MFWAGSLFLPPLIFWCIYKWDYHADEPYADRWLVLIGYIIGLSIGVHLLNLLTIPAMTFVYYFRKTKNITPWGVIKTFFIGGNYFRNGAVWYHSTVTQYGCEFRYLLCQLSWIAIRFRGYFSVAFSLGAILTGFYYANKTRIIIFILHYLLLVSS